eukprot:TRINITY_DN20780_c0_g1_i1.p1 TRINITY_DN20780_c0_g1~~TRINITY_DN20780_c0_g1_i1.p1  ORF type:complete len:960 (+),score=215.14 TRINITY_DN20780_c0_g1_i1:55-2934(+)
MADNCSHRGIKVVCSDFPVAWKDAEPEEVVRLIASELEAHGTLLAAPSLLGSGQQAVAHYGSRAMALAAIEALHGRLFSLKICALAVRPTPLGGGDAAAGAHTVQPTPLGGGDAAAGAHAGAVANGAGDWRLGEIAVSSRAAAVDATGATVAGAGSAPKIVRTDKFQSVFIGNLPFDSSEDELRDIFSSIGFVAHLRLVYDKETQVMKGYGFCDYLSAEKAKLAVEELNDSEYKGRKLRVSISERSLGDVGSSAGANDASADAEKMEVEVTGLPARWSLGEVVDFLANSTRSKLAGAGIAQLAPTFGAPTLAGASFRLPAREAAQVANKLRGQKIAGQALTVKLNGALLDPNGPELEIPSEAAAGSQKRSDKSAAWLSMEVFIDALDLTMRPNVEPAGTDREVFVERLPDDDELEGDYAVAFGAVEEMCPLPEPSADLSEDCAESKVSSGGYIRFQDHAAASRCVEAGEGSWSESERALNSQFIGRRQRKACDEGAATCYPESLIALILGPRGERILSTQREIGARQLSLRGKGLEGPEGRTDEQAVSSRLHFFCRGPLSSLRKLKLALERLVKQAHEEMKEKIAAAAKRKTEELESPAKKEPALAPVAPAPTPAPSRSAGESAALEAERTSAGGKTAAAGAKGINGGAGCAASGAAADAAWRPPPHGEAPPHHDRPPGAWNPGLPPHPALHGAPPPHPPAWGPCGWPPPLQHPSAGPLGAPLGALAPPPQPQLAPPGVWSYPAPGPWATAPLPPQHVGAGPEPPMERQRRRDRDAAADSQKEPDRERRRRRRHADDGVSGSAAAAPLVAPIAALAPVAAHDRDRKRRRRHRGDDGDRAPGAGAPTEAAAAVEPARGDGAATSALASANAGEAFLAGLPDDLTAEERDLLDAVLAFLGTWRSKNGAGSNPNLVHLGGDPAVRACKTVAMPRDVSLKAWMRHRIPGEVAVEGQAVRLLLL